MICSRLTRLQTFLGCIPIRVGCLILSYIEIVGHSYGIYNAFTTEDDDWDWEENIVYILGAVGLTLLNVLLAIGIHATRKWLLVPWLVVKFCFYLGFSVLYIVRVAQTAFIIPDIEQQNLRLLVIGFLCLLFLLLLLAWYTFFCVYSYYNLTFSVVKKEDKKDGKKDAKNETKNETEEKKEQ